MSTFRRALGNGLALKTAITDFDVDRVANLVGNVFEKGIGELSRRLFTYHPNTRPEGLIFIENEKTGELISTLCLITWQWRYDKVTLKVGEMGIVGTLEPYRNRGLIRAQADYFKELLIQQEFDLSIIQGIPYFYRQFGYEYALPLEKTCRMELYQVPDPRDDEKSSFNFRFATSSDLHTLKRLYDEACQDLSIYSYRSDSIWDYLMEHNPKTPTSFEIWIVEDANAEIAGYFCIPTYTLDGGVSLTVRETSQLSYDASVAVLQHLKQLAIEREKQYIRLDLPSNCTLLHTAHYHGASDIGAYAWQIHLPDMIQFLSKIRPVLERRLASSPFAEFSEEIQISFYEEQISLQFVNGKIADIRSLGFSSNWQKPIRIPPKASVPLLLGYRSREESCKFWHDMGAQPKQAYLLDVLFPKMECHICAIY